MKKIMKKQLSFTFLVLFVLSSCAQNDHKIYTTLGVNDRIRYSHKKIPKKLKIPSNCSDNDIAYEAADLYKTAENFGLEMTGVKVSAKEINNFGDTSLKQLKKSGKYKFITSGKELKELNALLHELLSVRKNPSDIKYKIHLIDDKMINAFTVGGHIIITTSIINEVNSLSAVASIIGHEIGHNEKGHLTSTIKKIKVIKEMGSEEAGQIGVFLQKLIMPAFNQPNEIEADLYGIDLSYAAGFNPKFSIILWKKLRKKEDKSIFKSFLRSHPYSTYRLNCIKKYLKINYKIKI